MVIIIPGKIYTHVYNCSTLGPFHFELLANHECRDTFHVIPSRNITLLVEGGNFILVLDELLF